MIARAKGPPFKILIKTTGFLYTLLSYFHFNGQNPLNNLIIYTYNWGFFRNYIFVIRHRN